MGERERALGFVFRGFLEFLKSTFVRGGCYYFD